MKRFTDTALWTMCDGSAAKPTPDLSIALDEFITELDTYCRTEKKHCRTNSHIELCSL